MATPRTIFASLAILVPLMLLAGDLFGAQAKRKPPAPPADSDAAEAPKPAPKKPPPRPIARGNPKEPKVEDLRGNDLRTADGVSLHATFYPGEKTKDTVPVILLHGLGGSRADFALLAEELQGKLGCAVLVPDLRGHGDSTQMRLPNGAVRTLDSKKLGQDQIGAMVTQDMETLKNFLRQRNNKGELNLEKLAIVGSELGALVAMNWAVDDWSWPQYPGLKQGQYVKALVLLSPPYVVRGLSAAAATGHPAVRSRLSIYVLAGKENAKLFSDSQRIYKALERFHPDAVRDAPIEQKDLWFKGLDTKLQGTKMLEDETLKVSEKIVIFIQKRLVEQDIPWQEAGKKAAASSEK